MNLLKRLLIIILFAIPLSSILYKNYIAKIDLIPQSATDKWHLSINYQLDKITESLGKNTERTDFTLPFFSATQFQKVDGISFRDGENHSFNQVPGGKNLILSQEDMLKKSITSLLTVELVDGHDQRPIKTKASPKELKIAKKKFLSLDRLNEEELRQLKLLNRKIISPEDTLEDKAKKIYFLITEEITQDEETKTISEALSLSTGSNLIKSRLFTYLCRLNGIPSRINVTYELSKIGQVSKLDQVFMPEIMMDGSWILVATDLTPFNSEVKNFFIFYKSYEDFPRIFAENFISVSATSVMVNKVDSIVYTSKLKSVSSLFSLLSLHNLPVNVHSVFYTVLLIPLGTLILSFSRNLLGIKSFGIFTPILLSLFFLETSLGTGLIFFTLIVLLGFGQRYLLDRLYLLAIPRLSILLTLVIISYTLFSLVVYQNTGFFQVNQSINYLPIVIITGFIERFSIHFVEEGSVNTLKALVGTLTISFLCYVIFQLSFLRQMLFNNPELLLAIIALNLMIGSYKGYRLSEFFRFREFEGINDNV